LIHESARSGWRQEDDGAKGKRAPAKRKTLCKEEAKRVKAQFHRKRKNQALKTPTKAGYGSEISAIADGTHHLSLFRLNLTLNNFVAPNKNNTCLLSQLFLYPDNSSGPVMHSNGHPISGA